MKQTMKTNPEPIAQHVSLQHPMSDARVILQGYFTEMQQCRLPPASGLHLFIKICSVLIKVWIGENAASIKTATPPAK